MASKKHVRRRAREAALAVLYSGDITEKNPSGIVEDGSYPAEEVALSDYAEVLVSGVVDNLEDIDARLAATSENWSVDRMPVVDRVILRIAVYEMLYVDEVPVSVAINEAVELAKAYGGEDESSRFVNGVLGRIARAEEAAGEDAEALAEAPVEEAAEAPAEAPAEEAAEAAGVAAEAPAEEAPASDGEAE